MINIPFLSKSKKYYNSLIRHFSFSKGIGGILFNPFYLVRKDLYKNISELAPVFNGRLLDVGCGTKPYEKLFYNASEYVGLDIDKGVKNLYADYTYDGVKFPFKNKSYDGVFASQVLEHVFNPDVFLLEIYRVLKKDGFVLLTLPFVWDEHEQPYDYARYSSFGIKYLLEMNGFTVIEQRKTVPNIGVIFQLLNTYIYKVVLKKSTVFRWFVVNSLTGIFNIIALVFISILPTNNDLYMDNIILLKKK